MCPCMIVAVQCVYGLIASEIRYFRSLYKTQSSVVIRCKLATLYHFYMILLWHKYNVFKFQTLSFGIPKPEVIKLHFYEKG